MATSFFVTRDTRELTLPQDLTGGGSERVTLTIRKLYHSEIESIKSDNTTRFLEMRKRAIDVFGSIDDYEKAFKTGDDDDEQETEEETEEQEEDKDSEEGILKADIDPEGFNMIKLMKSAITEWTINRPISEEVLNEISPDAMIWICREIIAHNSKGLLGEVLRTTGETSTK